MAERGLTIWAVAQKTELHSVTVKKILQTGRANPKSIKLVADFLGFSLAELVKRGKPMQEIA